MAIHEPKTRVLQAIAAVVDVIVEGRCRGHRLQPFPVFVGSEVWRADYLIRLGWHWKAKPCSAATYRSASPSNVRRCHVRLQQGSISAGIKAIYHTATLTFSVYQVGPHVNLSRAVLNSADVAGKVDRGVSNGFGPVHWKLVSEAVQHDNTTQTSAYKYSH